MKINLIRDCSKIKDLNLAWVRILLLTVKQKVVHICFCDTVPLHSFGGVGCGRNGLMSEVGKYQGGKSSQCIVSLEKGEHYYFREASVVFSL